MPVSRQLLPLLPQRALSKTTGGKAPSHILVSWYLWTVITVALTLDFHGEVTSGSLEMVTVLARNATQLPLRVQQARALICPALWLCPKASFSMVLQFCPQSLLVYLVPCSQLEACSRPTWQCFETDVKTTASRVVVLQEFNIQRCWEVAYKPRTALIHGTLSTVPPPLDIWTYRHCLLGRHIPLYVLPWRHTCHDTGFWPPPFSPLEAMQLHGNSTDPGSEILHFHNSPSVFL